MPSVNDANKGKYLDLIHDVWTPEQFENNQLKVEKNPTLRVALVAMKQPGYQFKTHTGQYLFGRLLPEVMHKWDMDSESSIHNVSEALDQIACDLLNEGTKKVADANKEPLETRLAIVQECFESLKNLESNLKNHQVVVNKYNEGFIFKGKVVGCENHQSLLSQIQMKFFHLSTLKDHLEAQVERKVQAQQNIKFAEFNKIVDELEENLEHGLKIDKEVVLRSYPQLLEKAQALGIRADQPPVQRLQRLLNSHYVAHLIEKIENKQMPLPISISLLLKHMGWDEALSQEKTEKGRKALIAKLREYLRDEKRLSEQSSTDFVHQIQMDFVEIVSRQLVESQSEIELIRPLIEKLYLGELEFQQQLLAAEQKVRKEIEELIVGLQSEHENSPQLQFALEQWRCYQIANPIAKIMGQLLGDIDFNKLKAALHDPQALEAYLSELKDIYEDLQWRWRPENLENIYNEAAVAFIEGLRQKIAEDNKSWFERNAHAQRFRFDQSAWGDQQIFGDGVCLAINYRWIRYLMEHPAQAINSPDDLRDENMRAQKLVQQLAKTIIFQKNSKNEVVEEESGILPEDRKIQAVYQVESRLKINPTRWISPSILKRDHMEVQEIGDYQTTIRELIEDIVQNHAETLQPYKGGGIFGVAIYEHDQSKNTLTNGHAIGMQIDPMRDIYRFWDVNSGFYQYNTLDEMKTEFQGYMQYFYDGKYNCFMAAQYTPKDI